MSVTHYSGTIRKTLADGSVVSSSYVDTDAGEALYTAPTACKLTVKANSQPLTLTFSREMFDDVAMSTSTGTTQAITTDTVFYATAGVLTLSIAQSDGTVIYTGGVDLDPMVPVELEPAPTVVQVAADVAGLLDIPASVTAAEAKIFSTFTWSKSGEVTETETGNHRMYNDTGRALTISAVRLSATSVTTSALTVDVHKNGTTIFSTQADRPSVAAGQTTDKAVPNVTAWADGAYLTVDIDAVGSATDITVTVTAA